jgi:hypothetical protein
MPTPNEVKAKPAEPLPALPPKAPRRRSVRASLSWCFRRPPSRRRVKASQARALPEIAARPALPPMPEAHQ